MNLRDLAIGGIIGYFYAVMLTLLGALWLLAPTLGRSLLFYGIGAVVLALILKTKRNLMPSAFVGYGVHFVLFLYQNGLIQ